MQLTEREFHTPHSSSALGPTVIRRPLRARPRSRAQALLLVLRAGATPALMMPVMVGAVLGWWETGVVHWGNLLLALLGITTTGWGTAALWEVHDYARSQRLGSQRLGTKTSLEGLSAGFDILERRLLTLAQVRDLGRILLLIAGASTLCLALWAGWPILFFSGLSFVTIGAVIVLPLRFGHRGWGLSEGALWLSLGVLPLLTGYYGQTGVIGLLPTAVAGALGLFSVLLFFNYNAIHYRRDWLIHKRTLVVNLGQARALDASALLMVLSHVALLLVVTLSGLPLWGLIALAALPVGLGVFARLDRDHLTPDAVWRVYASSVHAAWLTGLLFCVGLALDRLL